jgi:predicted Fe-Mo cluster-binding NifX family protein
MEQNKSKKHIAMIIVFAVDSNKGWDSQISSRFGRAQGFLCFSKESGNLDFHSNDENAGAGHGAGIQSGQLIAKLKADVIITGGDIGPKALDVLLATGVKMIKDVGAISAKQAYENYKNNLYK